ncbi:hypothetical protein [Paenibacillus sp. Marseille-Q4541]|uniref:hypothetical protein n=1 Tax=Paenibacillus sp. Marseille-Q4541 TaxID=2831522 RepID=UPI001BACD4FF|nr:hypothetical protein [Paenibacillus sp. Marseille-Q4541]
MMNRQLGIKPWRIWVLGFLLLVVLLAILRPSEEVYYAWLDKEHGISCGEYNYIDGMGCIKDGQMISQSGSIFSGLTFIKKEMKYKGIEDGTVYKVNTVGFLNTFF